MMQIKTTLLCFFIAISLTACGGNVKKRNNWQREEDFKDRRVIYYNEFVASGGMIKDSPEDQVNYVKREIQNSLNQGTVIKQIK
jgi:hypothetical protein